MNESFGQLAAPIALPEPRSNTQKDAVTWSPGERFAREFHSGQPIDLECCYRCSGERVLLGNFSDSTFLVRVIELGIAIAESEGVFARGEANDCRLDFLLYQWLNGKRASLKKRFQLDGDFVIAKAYREENGDQHVLAHLRDMDPALSSLAKIRELADEGSDSERLRLGLQVLAERRSLRISESNEIDAIVKNALFSIDEIEPCNDEGLVDDVKARLWRALQDHLSETAEQFNKWFWSSSSNLESRLAKQCSAHNESELSRADVKSALFEIGWRGHKLIGRMFELGMRELRSHIPEQSENEIQIHDQLYARQPHLASLPLAMLLNYRRFALESFLNSVWACNVTEQSIGTLHTMLYFYSEMVRTRRAADRRAKRDKVLELYENIDNQNGIQLNGRSVLGLVIESLPSEDVSNCLTCRESSLDYKLTTTKETLNLNSLCRRCGALQPEKRYSLSVVKEWLKPDEE